MTISSRLQACVCVLAMALPLILAPLAEAETIHCGAGDVQCLIAAINQANADPHKTTIRLAGGTYALTSIDNETDGPNGSPSIVSPVTIEGGADGATLARPSGAPSFRILHIGLDGRLTLHRVNVTGGAGFTFSGGNPLSSSGGALLNVGGTVTAINSSFEGNIANRGGAVFNDHGTTTILDSTIANNEASSGGGLYNDGGVVDITRTVFEQNVGGGAVGGLWTVNGDVRIAQSRFTDNFGFFFVGGILVDGGTVSVVQTTIAGNLADGAGGLRVGGQAHVVVRDSAFVDNFAASAGGAIGNSDGTVEVTNTTFARNVVGSNGAWFGAAVLNFGTMTLVNSTFADNRPSGGGERAFPASVIASVGNATTLLQNTIVVHNSDHGFVQDCAGLVTSLGNNLIGDPFACNITLQLSDLTGEASLGAFTDDGTPGNAHYALLPDSPAVDVANDAACPKRDQIGRPRAPHCDIGAVEFRRSDVILATQ